MRILILTLMLSACTYITRKPEIVNVTPIPIIIEKEEPETPGRHKPVAKKPVVIVVPQPDLLPPCPPETGNKQKDLLQLLNCTKETADKTLPPDAIKK